MQEIHLKRRDFLAVTAASLLPRNSNAQPLMTRRTGVFALGKTLMSTFLPAFFSALRQKGWLEGSNLVVEHFAIEDYAQLRPLAMDLVKRAPDVIVTIGSANMVKEAMAITDSIPIVFGNGSDPVKLGLVNSINRPGANVTGVTYSTAEISSKRIDLLHSLVPAVRQIGILINPNNLLFADAKASLENTASRLGLELKIGLAASVPELESSISGVARERATVLIVDVDAFFFSQRELIVELCRRHGLLDCYSSRAWVALGGAMSYGDDRSESYRQIASYTARILAGESPSTLPIVRPTKFELYLNLRTLKSLGVDVPITMLAIADGVLE